MTLPYQPRKLGHLAGPAIVPVFDKELGRLVSLAKMGHRPTSPFNNPSNEWLIDQMQIFQDLPLEQQDQIMAEARAVSEKGIAANSVGRAADRVWPSVVVRLDTEGLGFFSQLGVIRRPDLTYHFIDGFIGNRDSQSFNEENQALFAEVFHYINNFMDREFSVGKTIIQSDRQITDAPGRSFHARQLLVGTRYLQIPLMWRHLTFDGPPVQPSPEPDILELSIPHWLDDLGLPDDLKNRVTATGMTQLIFKAPSKGLSLHLGFDYVGEHKMGPLSIAMFMVKKEEGLAVQAALSVARAKTLLGDIKHTALVTIGPSLHGKSTLTIMLDLNGTELDQRLGLVKDPQEGIYPMNDDIVLLRQLQKPVESRVLGKAITIPYGIDGTENNFYAMPFGLSAEKDPVTFKAILGSKESPNHQETLENVPIGLDNGVGSPDFLSNPVRNMRVILSRSRLIAQKGGPDLIAAITEGRMLDSAHVPMEDMHRIYWQAVMRQNTVIAPLRRVTLKQYIRILMYGEAVQMGAATGAIGRPYVEYFSDPFIIGLEDDNANLMFRILNNLEQCGLPQEYYVFNTGGVGADSNNEANGRMYKKIPREITLMLQEALLRDAVKFEYDSILGSDLAVAIVTKEGNEILDLRAEWLPKYIYGENDYTKRVRELSQLRYYGLDSDDKAGILRYTKVTNALYEIRDIPSPSNERELSWLLSFYWTVDQACNSLEEFLVHSVEGSRPEPELIEQLLRKYDATLANGVNLDGDFRKTLQDLGI